MTDAEKNQLLTTVKNHLRITWDEEDHELQSMVDRVIAYFVSITGAELDFIVEGQARHLLLERCRYVYNRSAEEFENNFRHELLNLQFSIAVKERRERLGSP